MSFLKEFQYTNTSARKFVYFNTFLSAASVSIIFIDLNLTMGYYFFYFPVFKGLFIALLISLFLGNMVGKFIFSIIKNSRLIFIIIDILFFVSIISLIFRNTPFPTQGDILTQTFFISPTLLTLIIALPLFFLGIKGHYFLKILSSDFLDEKNPVTIIPIIVFSGIFLGGLLWILIYLYTITIFTFLAVPLLLTLTIPFINYLYNPQSQYAREYESESQIDVTGKDSQQRNDSLFFTYTHIAIFLISMYCIYLEVIKDHNALLNTRFIFFSLFLIILIIGVTAGKLIKLPGNHGFLLFFYPPLFLIPFFIIYHIPKKLPLPYSMLLFAPYILLATIVLTFNFRKNILQYPVKNRFSILEYSLLIIPAPILISLSYIPFTMFWFYTLVYLLCLISILLPGYSIIQRNHPLYKKGLVFAYLVSSISLVLLFNMLFPIKMNRELFISHTENFSKLQDINYNAPYIKGTAIIDYMGKPVFTARDSIIRNLKRSLAPVALYLPEQDTARVLFIDGNQRFFRNPGIGYFKNSLCLDPLSDSSIDYNTLPVSGRQTYIPDRGPLLFNLRKNSNIYRAIVDFPNLADQVYNHFRFSREYYMLLKSRLTPDGIMVQVFSFPGCSNEVMKMATDNLSDLFKNHSIYLFSNILVIISSDNEDAFAITRDRYTGLAKFIQEEKEHQVLFFDEQHALSHLLFTDINDLKQYIARNQEPSNIFDISKSPAFVPAPDFLENYLKNDDRFLSLLPDKETDSWFMDNTTRRYEYNKKILSLLKFTEFYESRENHEKETEYLFGLKNIMDYHIALKEYLVEVLAYKEKSFFDAAVKYEDEKKWEKAVQLYKSILSINKDNFDANYRMGILSIILQDIDSAYNYLQNAMKLKRDDPKVLYQMGVLEFTRGDIPEAINYFNRALKEKEVSASIYLYLGLSNEELNNLDEAEYYYSKALMEDPNDTNIQRRIDNIKRIKDEERKKWQNTERKNQNEEEQDVDIPIPINKSAYEIRLDDEKKEKK